MKRCRFGLKPNGDKRAESSHGYGERREKLQPDVSSLSARSKDFDVTAQSGGVSQASVAGEKVDT